MNVFDHPEHYMEAALREAEVAAAMGEVPVGAVVVHDNRIIASAHNEVEARSNATLHAEMLAIERASGVLGSWRLEDAALFVTLEPCTMCIGAMVLARLGALYFAAYDPRQGAVGSLYDLSQSSVLPHQIPVYPGLLSARSEDLLKNFFADCRTRGRDSQPER